MTTATKVLHFVIVTFRCWSILYRNIRFLTYRFANYSNLDKTSMQANQIGLDSPAAVSYSIIVQLDATIFSVRRRIRYMVIVNYYYGVVSTMDSTETAPCHPASYAGLLNKYDTPVRLRMGLAIEIHKTVIGETASKQ